MKPRNKTEYQCRFTLSELERIAYALEQIRYTDDRYFDRYTDYVYDRVNQLIYDLVKDDRKREVLRV